MDKEHYQRLLTLRKSEEELFYQLLLSSELSPRELIEKLPINDKRAHYLLSKWCARGRYDYGVALDLGWLVKKWGE